MKKISIICTILLFKLLIIHAQIDTVNLKIEINAAE